jgi:glycosyltransferase involved in cell wall biosynthesis
VAAPAELGGICECIEDGVTGILVAGPPDEEMPPRLVALAEDEAEQRRLSENARIRIREHFTIRPITDDYMTFYQTLLAS